MEIIKQDYAKKLVMEAPSNKTTQKDAWRLALLKIIKMYQNMETHIIKDTIV